ncbi:hypothetical protein [Bradyrhizobium sp. USDA 3315]
MDEFFASKPATNDSYLCVGPLTKSEAADVAEAGIGNGLGYYLYVSAIDSRPGAVEVLARLGGEDAARRLCDLLGLRAYSPV